MREYLESYSNFAYNLVGFIALLVHGDIVFCAAMQVLGCGSFTYHWHKKKPIFLFDCYAMSLVNTVVAGIHFDNELVWFGLFAVNMLYAYFIMGKINVFLETGFSSAIALLAILLNRSTSTFILIVIVFVTALLLRSKDEDPTQAKFNDSIWHSIWHLMTAGGYYMAVYLDL